MDMVTPPLPFAGFRGAFAAYKEAAFIQAKEPHRARAGQASLEARRVTVLQAARSALGSGNELAVIHPGHRRHFHHHHYPRGKEGGGIEDRILSRLDGIWTRARNPCRKAKRKAPCKEGLEN